MMEEVGSMEGKGYNFQPYVSKNSRRIASQRNSGVKAKPVHERLYNSKDKPKNTHAKRRSSHRKLPKPNYFGSRSRRKSNSNTHEQFHLTFKKRNTSSRKEYPTKQKNNLKTEYQSGAKSNSELEYQSGSANKDKQMNKFYLGEERAMDSEREESYKNQNCHTKTQSDSCSTGSFKSKSELYKRKDVLEKFSSITSTKFLRDFETLQKTRLPKKVTKNERSLRRKKSSKNISQSRNASRARLGIIKKKTPGIKKGRKLPNEELNHLLDNILSHNSPQESQEFEEQLVSKMKDRGVSESFCEQLMENNVNNKMIRLSKSTRQLKEPGSFRQHSKLLKVKSRNDKRKKKCRTEKHKIKDHIKNAAYPRERSMRKYDNEERVSKLHSEKKKIDSSLQKLSTLEMKDSVHRKGALHKLAEQKKDTYKVKFRHPTKNKQIGSRGSSKNRSNQRLKSNKNFVNKDEHQSNLNSLKADLESLTSIRTNKVESPLIKIAKKLNSLKQPSEFLPPTSKFGVHSKSQLEKTALHEQEERERDYLLIDGTKIFYDKNSIGGIVDINKRLNII